MFSHSTLERFKLSKEELAKLGSEFNSIALPMIEQLYKTSFWILMKKKFARKLVKQTFFEAIENCNVTKNEADWPSWILRIWMREIFDFYSRKENDIQTNFDFIDHSEVFPKNAKDFFTSAKIKSGLGENELIKSLEGLPSVLRVPMIMKEIHFFNYEKIAELIDVPSGVIATRIYRARKLLFLSLNEGFVFEDEKIKWGQREPTKKIFELRKCALLADDEITPDQKSAFITSVQNNVQYESEILIQQEIKRIFKKCASDAISTQHLKSKIERKAKKKFGQD